jgi:hypothetical protein
MSINTFDDLYLHYGHQVVIARYEGLDGDPVGVAVECEDCNEVLFDYDKEKEGEE